MSVINRFFIGLFFLILSAPFIQLELKTFPELELNEKRMAIPKPIPYFRFYSINGFKSSLEFFSKYLDDNFGFRKYFIYYHNRLKVSLFHVSPSSQAVVGKMNWLYYDFMNSGKLERTGLLAGADKSLLEFYNVALSNIQKGDINTTEYSLPDYLGLVPLEESELSSIKNNIESLERLLSKHKIRLLIVVAPNKHTIYPEFLPDWITNIKRRESRLDQVMKYMNENSNFKISDYRNIFLKNKVNQKLFLKLDTHLSPEGNILFANEILASLENPLVKKFESIEFNPGVEVDQFSGDLVDIAGIPGLFQETVFFLQLRKTYTIPFELANHATLSKSRGLFTVQSNKSLPSVIVFGDSFGEFVSPLLKERFKKYIFFPRIATVKEQILAQEKPDYVIIEIVERSIHDLKKFNFVEK